MSRIGGDMPFNPDTNGTLDTNLQDYWKCNELSGTTIVNSIRAKNGTLSASSSFNTGGKVAGCVSNIGGSGNTLVAPLMSTINNFSFACWAFFSNLSQANFILEADGLLMAIHDGNGGAGNRFGALYNPVVWLDSGSSFGTINTWYHCVMLRSAGVTKFYLNGVQTPNTFTVSPAALNGNCSLANQVGRTDEIGIWTKILTQTEINDLYNGGLGNTYSAAASDEHILHRIMLSEP